MIDKPTENQSPMVRRIERGMAYGCLTLYLLNAMKEADMDAM